MSSPSTASQGDEHEQASRQSPRKPASGNCPGPLLHRHLGNPQQRPPRLPRSQRLGRQERPYGRLRGGPTGRDAGLRKKQKTLGFDPEQRVHHDPDQPPVKEQPMSNIRLSPAKQAIL